MVRASTDRCQEEIYEQLDFDTAPINRVLSTKGNAVMAEVQLGDTALAIAVWQVRVGRTNIYLLDTDLVCYLHNHLKMVLLFVSILLYHKTFIRIIY